MEYDIQILHSYLRMSTSPQALGNSERRQVDKMRDWTLAQGAIFDDTFRDIASGFYGAHRRHGSLARFLEAVRNGELSPKGRALGIESFDRLTREHSWDADTLIHEIIDSGIAVVIESLGFLILTRERMLREPHLQHLIIAETTRARAESELRRIIQGIILYPGKQRDPNRFVTVHLKPDVDGNRITYAFSPETLIGIHAALPDGRTAFVGPSVLAQIAAGNPKITIRIADDGHGHYQAMTT